MSARPRLELASDSTGIDFGPRGQVRETFATSGRIHIDRWLPFLVLHRSAEPEESVGRRVALNSPAYFVWSPDEDGEAESALDLIVNHLRAKFGPVLLIELCDEPAEEKQHDSPTLAPLDVRIAASPGKAAQAASEALAKAVGGIRIDSHRGETVPVDLPSPVISVDGADRLLLGVPQIHRAPDGRIYPQLTHDLVAQLVDSILCAAAAFIGEVSQARPPHFRSLGRSAFITAALNADKKLDAIARSFDFLLSISPINTAEARSRFFDSGEQVTPSFKYRPLTVDPDLVKRDLYAIDLSPDFANFYPAVPYPGTALYEKVRKDGMLANEDWSKMEYSYYLLDGHGLNELVVMAAINRAKRRFFLRPRYLTQHLADAARLAWTKPAIVTHLLSRVLFGQKVIDVSPSRLALPTEANVRGS